MKISISVPGRLHAFQLAYYFQKLNMLGQLITGYPKFVVTKHGIRKELITSLYVNEIINRSTRILLDRYPFDYEACEAFDWLNRYTLNHKYDVYFIWSSYGLHTMRYLRKVNPGAKVILVRGSAHIEEQERLLQMAEGKKVINPKIIGKELKEYELADAIVVPSLFAKNTFIKRGIASAKIFSNPLGVNLECFPFQERNFDLTELVVGYAGNISAQKNILGLINAVKTLTDIGLHIRLKLVGSIDKGSFDPLILQQHSFIDYQTSVSEQKLYKQYKQMHLFVLNTIQDGFAVVLLQAMSTGLPIISTCHSGGPDVVEEGKNGFIIPILSDELLAEKIKWFYYNRSSMGEMSRFSRAITEQDFTWDDFGFRHLGFLKELTGK